MSPDKEAFTRRLIEIVTLLGYPERGRRAAAGGARRRLGRLPVVRDGRLIAGIKTLRKLLFLPQRKKSSLL